MQDNLGNALEQSGAAPPLERNFEILTFGEHGCDFDVVLNFGRFNRPVQVNDVDQLNRRFRPDALTAVHCDGASIASGDRTEPVSEGIIQISTVFEPQVDVDLLRVAGQSRRPTGGKGAISRMVRRRVSFMKPEAPSLIGDARSIGAAR
jgi:hypothetical protein